MELSIHNYLCSVVCRNCTTSASRNCRVVSDLAEGSATTMSCNSPHCALCASSTVYTLRRSVLRVTACFATFLPTTTEHFIVGAGEYMHKKWSPRIRRPFLYTVSNSRRERRSRFFNMMYLYGELCAPFLTATLDDPLATRGAHAHQKAVGLLAFSVLWLVCSLWHI